MNSYLDFEFNHWKTVKKDIIIKLSHAFKEVAHLEQGVEYWMARDLQRLFEYSSWDNFLNVVEKAKIACTNSKMSIQNHFHDIIKMVDLGSGTSREIPDVMLSRYACYLIAQNGDPKKESIAFAQSYFALQTRKQELLEQHIAMVERLTARHKLTETEKELSSVLYQHGVDDQGFARIRSKGDQALFGGHTTIEMKQKLGIPKARALADFLPTITIKAKDFAGEITHFNVKKENMHGDNQIAEEHVKNNLGVRRVLIESNIYPENLPAEEDIKKIEKRIKKDEERITDDPKVLPSIQSTQGKQE